MGAEERDRRKENEIGQISESIQIDQEKDGGE
jgi:hypothetical protein